MLTQIKLDTFLQSVLYLCSASEFIKYVYVHYLTLN